MANLAARIEVKSLKILGWLLIAIMMLILLGILGGPTFSPILRVFGLEMLGERGIFLNCTLPENKHNEFCRKGGRKKINDDDIPPLRQQDKNLPFNLY